jgi:hypothetical protein
LKSLRPACRAAAQAGNYSEEIRIHNEEQPSMDINDLFDGIMKSINQFAPSGVIEMS